MNLNQTAQSRLTLRLAACGLAILWTLFGTCVCAQTTRSTTLPTPTADFELHEWAVFVAEPLAPRANAVAAIKSTLPSFVVSRRPDADPDERMSAMPIGVIRIVGGKTPSPKFDVLLNLKGGDFQGHWPKAENNRNNRLLWSNLIADETQPTLSQLDPKHWLNRLREPESRYLTAGHDTRGERFLLYDAEPTFNMPLKVEASGENGYRIGNTSADAISNLELYKSKPDGWHGAFAATVGASRAAATKPATTKPVDTAPPKIKPGDTITVAVDFSQLNVIERVKTAQVSDSGEFSAPLVDNFKVAGKTTEQLEKDFQKRYTDQGIGVSKVTVTLRPKEQVTAATGPTGPVVEISLSNQAVSDPKQLLAAWKDRLEATGLAPLDTDLILDILAKYAIDSGRLTGVYMLDQKQMDDLLPEEVVPTPAKTVRVGLVVVRNIDPQINDEIAQLVKQLGDDEWSKREEAQKKLTTFGRAAKNAVEKATHEKDLEVVWRAEAVLRTIDPQKYQPLVPQ